MASNHNKPVGQSRAAWQLPPGVSRGTWDYVTQPSIATEYDSFHAGHPLLDLDRQLVAEHLGEASQRGDGTRRVAIDVGCGTGRNLIPLAEKGWHVIGADLSEPMLREFFVKAAAVPQSEAVAIRANMVHLECIADGIADAVLCMYSSLGMVQGRENRRSFMRHAARILRPEGRFFVHVHNRGSWLRDPGGVRRTMMDWIRARRDPQWELGDRVYAYRGLPSMFLHVYSERELKRDLSASGLDIVRYYRLNRQSSAFLQGNWFPHLRSGGFLAVCKRRS
jgi:SAM-dependent methyltransferase